MTAIQIKSLKHCIRLLQSVDSYPIHSALSAAMRKEGISEEAKERIINCVRDAILTETSKAYEAKEWAEALLVDE
jgi:hypothetical protein